MNRDEEQSYSVNEVYQKLQLFTLNEYQDFEVVGFVDSLLVYPEYKGNYLCCVMTEETYDKHYYCFEYPEYIYFNSDDKDTIDRIRKLAGGTSYVQIYNQYELLEEINRGYYQTLATYIIIFIMCILAVTINIIIMNQFEFEVNKKNLAMERILGIGKSVQAKVALLESLIIYAGGILIGALGIYLINEKTVIFSLNASKIMDIKEILIVQAILYLVATIIVMISSIIMNNKIKILVDLEG